jgi:hypothetical protein
MFQLQIANADITNGNAAVSWCVEPADLKLLSDAKVSDPQVVIIVAPVENYSKRREYRKVVPLKDLMTYLEFRSAGKNNIWAFISFETKKVVHDEFLTKGYNGYITDLLSSDGSGWSYIFRVWGDNTRRPELNSETLSVMVPANAFAKQPPAWEQAWVNHMFSDKPQDQCEYRRRRIFSYTLQPIGFFFNFFVIRTLMLFISSLWLSRGMSLQPLLHPLRYNTADTADVLKGGSWVIPHLPEDDHALVLTPSYLLRKLWKAPLMPLVWIPLLLCLRFHFFALVLFIVVCIFLTAALIVFLASGGAGKVWNVLSSFLSGKEKDELWYLDQEEVEAITCTPGMQPRTSIGALPAKHRTIRLYFQDLKSRVCRPFSA